MTSQELKELKINALALRNIASKVLEQVELAERKGSALPPKTRIHRKSITASDLIERIHTNRKKPILAK